MSRGKCKWWDGSRKLPLCERPGVSHLKAHGKRYDRICLPVEIYDDEWDKCPDYEPVSPEDMDKGGNDEDNR